MNPNHQINKKGRYHDLPFLSGPMTAMDLSLGELGPASRSPSPVFLPFLDPRIAGQETGLLQSIFELLIIQNQGFRNSVTDGLGLARTPSSVNIDSHIELVSGPREIEGLEDDHFAGLPLKKLLQCPLIYNELPFPGFQPYPCNRCLSLSCCVNRFCHVFSPF